MMQNQLHATLVLCRQPQMTPQTLLSSWALAAGDALSDYTTDYICSYKTFGHGVTWYPQICAGGHLQACLAGPA